MERLNLPEYQFRMRGENGRTSIFDEIRKKYVALTPEEWVRQNFLKYLLMELNYPAGLLAVEYEITVNNLSKRCDAVVFSRLGKPVMILEFKAPDVKLSQAVFDQIIIYNRALGVNYLAVSNGVRHFCCVLDHENRSYRFLQKIPVYEEIQGGPGI
ncbi:MAG: type I restriction enzyme HsdR N-terminal domain-containing protein [Bacteroidales bacterium]|nr:type I restriction enzyme HsdR N-terminal domain-containing protein [Bacteroidales bacterium]